MFWHSSSLVTTRSGRYAPTLSRPTLVGPLFAAAICCMRSSFSVVALRV
ncbi:hypothetical protein [Mycobacterium tilburgii]|nr:hypothetical protein [Mycobacterium tilburgii]